MVTFFMDTDSPGRQGWVLTGGKSSRMGVDKALAEVGGIAMALRVADVLGKVCDSVSIVGDPERYSHLGLAVLPDNHPGQGPLAGIEAALASTSSDWNLIVACDMPSLNATFLETLLQTLEETGRDCALPRHPDGKLEPLCAAYHRRALHSIRTSMESGIRKVTDALRPLAVTYVPAGSIESFANLNTPDDLRKYLHG